MKVILVCSIRRHPETQTDTQGDHLPLIPRRTLYGSQDGNRHAELDYDIEESLVSRSTTATPKLAHFSPDLLILDALKYKREVLSLILASTCIAPTGEDIARLRCHNVGDSPAVQDIDVSELRGGKYYRAFVLNMASSQVSQVLIHLSLDHL